MLNQIINQRYEVVEKIAESPFFAVFKGRDRSANRVVVLKALQPAYSADMPLIEGLQAGFQSAENLNHPNIAPCYEQGIENGRPYFVTEYVRGINLKERVRRIAPFTLSVAVDFGCSIADALHFAHSIGQVHGNLRPQDIIVSPEGQVKVTDFGVQKGVSRSTKAQQEMLRTSAPYHAPELSTTHLGTPAGDIYALGALLYEMLTGTPPYVGDNPDALADKHAFAEIPSPRTINPGVPRSVEGIIVKCLQKKPEDRYRSVADLLNDLKSVRDALRFGKPLSWTPIDIDAARQAPLRPIAALPKPEPEPPKPTKIPEPVAAVAASSQVMPMPAENRLRRADERVSIYIKAALVSVTVIIFVALIGLVGIWSSMWAVPPSSTAPELVGRSIVKVRELAKSTGAILHEHAEFSEKKLNIVYKTNLEKGTTLRAKQIINVWYSKGSGFVDVPNVTKLTRDEAEKKLEAAGLVVGTVTPVNSETVIQGYIISQNVSPKKRVLHDTVVSLTVSDGPKMEYADPNEEANAATNRDDNFTTDSASIDPDNAVNEHGRADDGPKTCRRSLTIPRDRLGIRQVRVEFTDARGSQIPVDEPHGEGDSIPIQFEYWGKTVTLVVYYDGEEKKRFTFNPQKDRRRKIR